MRVGRLAALTAASIVALTGAAFAGEYLTAGADNGRTGWVQDDKIFTKANVRNTKLLWKVKLDSPARRMHNLFPPLIAENVMINGVATEVVIVPGISNDLFALDAKTGRQIWTKRFVNLPFTISGQDGTLCPGGQLAIPTIQKLADGRYKIWALAWDGRLRQVDAATGQDMAEPENFQGPNGKPYALNLHNGVVYTSVAQGCGQLTFQMNSFDSATRRTSAFFPAGGGMWGRRGVAIDSEGRAYMGTGDGSYQGNNLGNAIVAAKLDAQGVLQSDGWFAPIDANWAWKRDLDVNVSPIAIDYRGKKFLLATYKGCTLWLMDRDNLGGSDHRQALDTSPTFCNDEQWYDAKGVWGDMSAAVQSDGKLWVYAPFWGRRGMDITWPRVNTPAAERGGVAAFTVEQVRNQWKVVPKWVSQDMNMGDGTILVNGIVFAYGSGEDTRQQATERAWDEPAPTTPQGGGGQSEVTRIANSTHATLYALDGLTGQTLWNSGDQITSFNHFSGLSAANGRVYIGTYDGTLYAFGIER